MLHIARLKHRYWTSLLLLARVAIYIVIIVFSHGDPNTNLLAIIYIVIFLLFLKGHIIHCLYKDWKTDIIETICYLNIVLFSVVKMVILNTCIEMIYHNIATSISGMITVLLFAYVIARQFCLRFVSSVGKKCKQRLRSKMIGDGIATSNNVYITNADGRSEYPHNL